MELPRDTPRGTVVLRGGRVITMKGKEILENADIVVKDNRILGGRRARPGAGARRRQGDRHEPGRRSCPGFIDLHYHPQWLHAEIHQAQPWQHLATLAYGVDHHARSRRPRRPT